MKGNSTIRIDYDNVLQQASRLSAIAASCGDVENRLRSAITMLTPAWEGPSGEACRAALQSRISEVRALRSQVEQMAAYIRKVAAEFQEAERRAAAAAGPPPSRALRRRPRPRLRKSSRPPRARPAGPHPSTTSARRCPTLWAARHPPWRTFSKRADREEKHRDPGEKTRG